MKIKIGEKISTGFAVILVLMVVMGIGAYFSLQNFNEATARVENGHIELHVAEQLKTMLQETLTLNDYIISGDIEKKGHFDFEYETVMRTLREIETSQSFYEGEKSYIDKIKRNLPLLRSKSDEVLKLADPVRKEFVSPAVNQLIEEIDTISLTLVENIEAITSNIKDRMSENKEVMDRTRILGVYIVIITTLLAVVLAVAIGLTLSRSITTPLRDLGTLARHVSKGDLTKEAKIMSGDEIGDLSIAFNRMVRDLRDSRSQLVEKDYVDSIIANMNDTLIVSNAEGRIKTVNNAALNLLGYTEEELIDQPVEKVFGDEFRKPDIDDLAKEGPILHVEKNYLSKDHNKIPMLFSSSIIRHMNGRKPWIVYVAQDITELKRVAEEVKGSLKEKEVLLKEVHHRVKNNLQVISSLLSLQAGYVKDPAALAMFNESRCRIQSMALIHKKLYESHDLARIDFSEYLRSLTASLYMSCCSNMKNVTLDIDIEDVMLNIDTAIPCGLLVNELVTNSLKHAFPQNSKGEISIHLNSDRDSKYLLTVGDNGVGFPENLDFRKTESLGMQLVLALTDQLDGAIEIDRSEGTTFKITFEEQ